MAAPKYSKAAVKAHPAPVRSAYAKAAEYAKACKATHDAREVFDAPIEVRSSVDQRRTLFVEAYIANGGNATQAAKSAGFSEKTANEQGCRLLTNVNVSSMIARRQQELADKYALTTDSVIRELGRIVHLDPRKFFKADGSLKAIVDMDDDCVAALASVEVDELRADGAVMGITQKIKFWDKNAAIEKAMKHLGLFEKDNKQKLADLTDDQLKAKIESLSHKLGLSVLPVGVENRGLVQTDSAE